MMNELLAKEKLTEEEFLEIINAGMQSELQLETEVTLPNPLGTTDVWVVADVNHDGTSGTVDLISKNLICDTTRDAYGGYFGESQIYKDSTIRSWLTNTFITGFSTAIQTALKTMDVKTDIDGSIVSTQDKIKLLSMNEVGFTNSDWKYIPSTAEGTIYPIFESGEENSAKNKRLKCKSGEITPWWYYTRSRITGDSDFVCCVCSYGSYNSNYCANTYGGVVPAIRF